MKKQQGYGLRLQKPTQQGRLHLTMQPTPPLRLTLSQQPAQRQSLTLTPQHRPQHSHSASHGSFIGYQIDTTQTPWQQTNKPVFLPDQARNRGVYLLGKPGTGKTTLFLQLLLADIAKGIGVCFIDPAGDAINDLIACIPPNRLRDVIVLDPFHPTYYFPLNLFHCEDPADIAHLNAAEERILHLFTLLYAEQTTGQLGVQISDYLTNTSHVIIKNHLTMAEIPLLFASDDIRSHLLEQVSSDIVQTFWRDEAQLPPRDRPEKRRSLFNKVTGFLRNAYIEPIVSSEDTLPFRQIMDDPAGKILLIKLDNNQKEFSRLIGAAIIACLCEAALTRKDLPKEQRRLFNIYADEYHEFATSDWAEMVEQARKYHVGAHFGHQRLSQLPASGRDAALLTGSKFIFRILGKDASEEIAGELDCTPLPPPIEGYDMKPKYIPAERVTQELVKGHTNPRVVALVNKWIRPPVIEGKELRLINDAQLHQLDHFFANAMTGRCRLQAPEQIDLLCGVMVSLFSSLHGVHLSRQ